MDFYEGAVTEDADGASKWGLKDSLGLLEITLTSWDGGMELEWVLQYYKMRLSTDRRKLGAVLRRNK